MLEEFKNAFQRHNNAHIQLIIINVVVFAVLGIIYVFSTASEYVSVFESVYRQFSMPPGITEFLSRPWTLLTYSFAHSIPSITHILFNMLALYWFGKLFIDYLGSDKLIAIYVLGAVAGGIVYLLMFNTIPFFINNAPGLGMVGASASVFAIMVATATLLPDYTFNLIFLGPVRIKYIVAIYIVISFLGSVGPNAGGNLAHLGGALMGFIYTKQLQAGVNWGGWITAVIYCVKGLFNPRQNVKVTYRKEEKTTAKPKSNSKSSQDEIDHILDKISEKGYESLSKDEKEKLFNASKR